MEGFLALGFMVGMGHALEADHLAAVGAMASEGGGRRRMVVRGALWGVGHTVTLFALCTAAILFGLALTETRSAALEFGVGAMLVLLGLDVLRRMRRQKVHFHVHRHGSGEPHIHAHSHANATVPHARDPHCHRHPRGLPLRVLVVGLMHGAAGSAGLLALAAAATRDPWIAIGYVLLFGVGSLLGMAALSFAAAWPLGWAEKGAWWLHRGVSLAAAAIVIVLGIEVMVESAATVWGAF